MSDVLEDWEWAKINLRATPAGKNAAGDALAAELTALRARAGQCRACRTLAADVRCDACADSGMVAEVARLRESVGTLEAEVALIHRMHEGERVTYQLALDVAKSAQEALDLGLGDAKTARRDALLEAADKLDRVDRMPTDPAEWLRALAGPPTTKPPSEDEGSID